MTEAAASRPSRPLIPISFNVIFAGQNTAALTRALDSTYGALYREEAGDECVVVYTAGSNADFKYTRDAVRKFPNARLLDRRADFQRDLGPIIEKRLGPAFLEEFKKHQGGTRGILDFAGARQAAQDASKNPLIFWIDSDDELVVLGDIDPRGFIDDAFQDRGLDCMMLEYAYAFNEHGDCITYQRRERILRRDAFYWKGKCHETAIPLEGTQPTVGMPVQVPIRIHHTDARKPHRISDIRNYAILAEALERENASGEIDPRTVFYLANSMRGLELFDSARNLYEQFLPLSGSPEDRFAALFYIAGMYLHPAIQRPFDAYDTYQRCIALKPKDPRGYFGLQQTCLSMQRFEESIHWYDLGRQLAMPDTQVMSYDPVGVEHRPHLFAANAYRRLGKAEPALECVLRAVRARPNYPDNAHFKDAFSQWAAGMKLAESVITTLQMTAPARRGALARSLRQHLGVFPEELERTGIGRIEPPDPRADLPEVAFICPGSGEEWGPASRATGIGGSEKMVILLAEALQATGLCNVSVYANVAPHERGLYPDGVLWQHWSEFDEKRPRHALVVWRVAELGPGKLQTPARFRIFWGHDVQDPARYQDDVLAYYDRFSLQSDFHAEPVKHLFTADKGGRSVEKLWRTRNAIEIPKDYGAKRLPKRVLYCSSWDRGLLTAAKIVEEAQKRDPDIHLVVTYGVNGWCRKAWASQDHRYLPDLGHESEVGTYERRVRALLDKIGATVLHRINFEQMNALMQESGVWLYPTRFPEISCMSAMEAQANGMVPVCTRFGALKETVLPDALCESHELEPVPLGEPGGDYIRQAASVLVRACHVRADDRSRLRLATAAREAFGIDGLVKQWVEALELGNPAAPEEEASTALSARRE